MLPNATRGVRSHRDQDSHRFSELEGGSMVYLRTLGGALTISLTLSTFAFAQGTADIVGRVTDTSGAVLPAVTVTAENIATKNVRTTVTTDTGDYVFTLLPIGTYTVRIELQGFQTVNSRVELATGDRARVDARMELGTVQENLTVSGESPLLQTDSATVSSLIDQKTVQDAPIPGRNIIRMVQLIPGANEGALSSLANGTRPDERRQTSSVSINGVNDVLNNQLVDGMDNNERTIGTVAIKPSIDAIAEVRVQTNMYTAETGRTLGGVINIITKSGGNQFHGSGFEFGRHEKFDSRLFFAQDKPLMRQNQFGGSLGGPLRRDRTFFFVDYEGYRLKQGVPSVVTVPTVKMRNGDFSELSTQIYDPITAVRTPFAGNVIPASRFDPIAVKYMQLYPLPTGPGLANNFAYTNQRTQDNDATDVRVDHRFDDRNTVFARYSYNKTDTLTPSLCPPTVIGDKTIDPTCIVGGAATGNYAGPNYTTAHNVTGSYVRILNATTIMEVKANYSKPDILSLGPNNNSNLGDFFGVPNANTGAQETSGLPLMEMRPTTIAALGETQWVPLQIYNRTKQYAGSISNFARRSQPQSRRGPGHEELWRAPVEFGPGALGLRFDADQQRRYRRRRQRLRVVPAWVTRQTCAGSTRQACPTTTAMSPACSSRTTGARNHGSRSTWASATTSLLPSPKRTTICRTSSPR